MSINDAFHARHLHAGCRFRPDCHVCRSAAAFEAETIRAQSIAERDIERYQRVKEQAKIKRGRVRRARRTPGRRGGE